MSDETKTVDAAEEVKDSEATDATSETASAEKKKEEVKEEVSKEETKKEEIKEEKAGDLPAQAGIDESVEVPKEFKKLVEEVEKMSVLELNELVKVLEKRFGVSASATAVAAPGGDGGDDGEQDSFTVELTEIGGAKIQVIKVVKEVLGLGLKEAKDMVDAAPIVVKEKIKKEEAEELKEKLEGAGATVALK